MKVFFIVIFILLVFVLINYYLDSRAKSKFIKENFPPNIVYEMKEIELPPVSEGKEIPKIIHRCYKDTEGINKFKEVFRLTRKRMPDFEQIYYTDDMVDEYIQKHFSERIYKAYRSINPEYGACKADFFRYLVIYREGGIYMDIKTGPNTLIDSIFEEKGKLLVSKGHDKLPYYFPKKHLQSLLHLHDDWSYVIGMDGSEWQQFVIAAPKGNPIISKVIQQVVTNIEEGLKNKKHYSSGNYSVVAMTGPITYSIVIEKYKEKYKDKIKFYKSGYDERINHSLVDYKKIMKDVHYSKIKDKCILK